MRSARVIKVINFIKEKKLKSTHVTNQNEEEVSIHTFTQFVKCTFIS